MNEFITDEEFQSRILPPLHPKDAQSLDGDDIGTILALYAKHLKKNQEPANGTMKEGSQ